MTAQFDLAALPHAPVGKPELLFGVRLVEDPRDSHWHGTMPSGRWTLGPDGVPSNAALAVLIDDTLGVAGAAHQPEGRFAVTTELSVDYVAPPPCDGSVITSEGAVVSAHDRGALVTGTVRDAVGQTLAVMSLRGRYIPLLPEVAAGASARPEPSPGDPADADASRHESLLAVLGASAEVGAEEVRLRVPPSIRLTNGSGVLHGGVALAASQLAASYRLPADEGMALASTRITYLRQLEISSDIDFVARVVHGGRTFRVVEVTAYGPGGVPCARATVAGYTATAR
ncbi:PaaI family thioesterase [Yinghuangia sp. ASG 101]|uniref:PaaI family thioesterase n=1 Tax=Yinghuangia sp. ASG 101 TaxID=2896848 RepID=UPI001E4F2CD0|nr:PaaI family thioesterase [Yinghuangia sp. ASG 101]UGQ12202.1 PaaI family thioesterase [Yinghuangia sp. ASG 101]